MGSYPDAGRNASIRGYIMRCLVRGYHFCVTVRTLVSKMRACGLISEPDISDHLYYLEQCGLIRFSDGADAFSSYNSDAVVKLTAEGIRFIENGGEPDMGIDL